jgi:hypothetical protein
MEYVNFLLGYQWLVVIYGGNELVKACKINGD